MRIAALLLLLAATAATNGPVISSGRGAGRTQIVVVTLSGQSSFDVVVTSSQPLVPQAKQATDGRVETRYAAVVRQVHNSVDVAHVDGERRTEAHVETARYGDYAGQQTSVTLPSISYRIFSPGREITFFDRYVDESP